MVWISHLPSVIDEFSPFISLFFFSLSPSLSLSLSFNVFQTFSTGFLKNFRCTSILTLGIVLIVKICWSHKEAQISISMHFIFSFFLLFLLSLYYCFTQIKYYTKQSKAKQKCMCVFSSDTLGHENCDLCTYSQKNFSPSKSQSHAQSQSQSPLKSQNPPLCSPTSPFDSCSFRSCFFFVRYSTVVPISIIIFARNIKKQTENKARKTQIIGYRNRKSKSNYIAKFSKEFQVTLDSAFLTNDFALNRWIRAVYERMNFGFSFDCVIWFLLQLYSFVSLINFCSFTSHSYEDICVVVLYLNSVWLSLECFPLILSNCLNDGSTQNVYCFMFFF